MRNWCEKRSCQWCTPDCLKPNGDDDDDDEVVLGLVLKDLRKLQATNKTRPKNLEQSNYAVQNCLTFYGWKEKRRSLSAQ